MNEPKASAATASAIAQTLSDDQMKALDWIVLFDHSGSMKEASHRFPSRSRWQELQEDAMVLVREAAKYDADGITVIAFSGAPRIFDNVKEDAIAKLFAEVEPRGSTDLTAALRLAIDKRASSQKNAVVLVYTDGIPDDKPSAFRLIDDAGKKYGRPGIGFCFIQVGQNAEARSFLDSINSSLSTDVTAVVDAGQSENLSLGQLGWLAQNQ